MKRTRRIPAEISAYLGRIVGGALGLVGGIYGLAAGFLIGFMLDEARVTGRIRRYFRDPAAPPPRETIPGLAAAAGLAMRGPWLSGEDEAQRRRLFLRLAETRTELGPPGRALLARELSIALSESSVDLGLLGRRLSLEGSREARKLLAEYAYGLLQLGHRRLDHRTEFSIRASLADAGLTAPELGAARSRHFPDYRDPWELLELSPGASQEELKRAFRRLSKRHHPDSRAKRFDRDSSATGPYEEEASEEAAAEARFRELHEAYEILLGDPLLSNPRAG